MKLKFVALAAALSACTLPALALHIVDWESHAPIEHGFGDALPGGTFDDVFLFSIDKTSMGAAEADPLAFLNLIPRLNINSKIELGKVELVQIVGNSNVTKATFNFTTDTGPSGLNFGQLDIGKYYYHITGKATGPTGGTYELTSTMIPTPEPGSFALLLAGLGVIGLLGRRRLPA